MAAEPTVGVFEAWRAHDLSADGLEVRVEFLPPPTDAAGFLALVKALRGLSDVALPRVLDGGLDGGAALLVSEGFEGRSLAHWLAGHRTAATLPSFGAAQRITERIGAGVRFLHESKGLDPAAHGALCARNVLLRRVGSMHTVKLLGAGLAPFAQGESGSRARSHLTAYLAPESDPSRPTSTPAADLFALAVLAVELLTTHARPEGLAETWCAIASSRGAALRDRLIAQRGDVPVEVWSVLARALSPSPRERPASVALLLRALRDAWTAAGRWDAITATEREPPEPSPESFARAVSAVGRRDREAAQAPVGWQVAERAPAAVSVVAPSPSVASSKPVAAPFDEEADRTEAIDVPSHDDPDDGADATDAMSRPHEIVAAVKAMRDAAESQGTLALDASSPFASSSPRAVDYTIAPVASARAERPSQAPFVTDPEDDGLATHKVTADEVARARRDVAAARVASPVTPEPWEPTEAHSVVPVPPRESSGRVERSVPPTASTPQRSETRWVPIAVAVVIAVVIVAGALVVVRQ